MAESGRFCIETNYKLCGLKPGIPKNLRVSVDADLACSGGVCGAKTMRARFSGVFRRVQSEYDSHFGMRLAVGAQQGRCVDVR